MGNNYKVKCKTCGESIDKDVALPHPTLKRSYFCNVECLEAYENGTRPANTSEYGQVTDYIQQLYLNLGFSREEINWGKLGQQLTRLKNYNGYKNSGILLTLKYYCETLGRLINPISGIQSIVENYYQEAKNHYIQTQHCKILSEDFEEDKSKIVQVSRSDKKHERYIIDLNDL